MPHQLILHWKDIQPWWLAVSLPLSTSYSQIATRWTLIPPCRSFLKLALLQMVVVQPQRLSPLLAKVTIPH